MRVILIGSNGFVGSAFARLLSKEPGIDLVQVDIHNRAQLVGTAGDVVIEAACNSRKFFAEEQPVAEFETSVNHRLRTLFDFPAPFHLHISSVDVYSDLSSPETTREDSPIDLTTVSHYGFHKLLAEQLVRHYARQWLIIRLAGMVGPGLRKNPVYDILHDQPLRIHPDSQYQFLHTDDVAAICWKLVRSGELGQVYNVAGHGLISPRQIAELAGKKLNWASPRPSDGRGARGEGSGEVGGGARGEGSSVPLSHQMGEGPGVRAGEGSGEVGRGARGEGSSVPLARQTGEGPGVRAGEGPGEVGRGARGEGHSVPLARQTGEGPGVRAGEGPGEVGREAKGEGGFPRPSDGRGVRGEGQPVPLAHPMGEGPGVRAGERSGEGKPQEPPRVVHASTDKISKVAAVPKTVQTLADFVHAKQ